MPSARLPLLVNAEKPYPHLFANLGHNPETDPDKF